MLLHGNFYGRSPYFSRILEIDYRTHIPGHKIKIVTCRELFLEYVNTHNEQYFSLISKLLKYDILVFTDIHNIGEFENYTHKNESFRDISIQILEDFSKANQQVILLGERYERRFDTKVRNFINKINFLQKVPMDLVKKDDVGQGLIELLIRYELDCTLETFQHLRSLNPMSMEQLELDILSLKRSRDRDLLDLKHKREWKTLKEKLIP